MIHTDDSHRIANLKIKMTRIGSIDNGIDGSDEYLLLEDTENGELTPDDAADWLHPQVYRNSHTPGAYYCHTVTAVQAHNERAVICTVQHRYDV